jgi:hypothetical protein
VRDRDEITQPGALYVRQKKAGVWSGWLKSAGVASSTTPPSPASDNSLWWDPARGKLFVRYTDADSSQWVEAVAVPEVDVDEIIDAVSASAVRYDVAQALTEPQQLQARTNIAVDAAVAGKAVLYDAAQSLTENQKITARRNIYAAPFDALAYSGMQINGSFGVSQQLGLSVAAASGYFCDGWQIAFSGTMAGNCAAYPQSLVWGISNSAVVQILTAQASVTGSNFALIMQSIEGYRIERLGWGTPGARPVTIGFWTSHHRPGVYSVVLRNAASDRSCGVTYTHNAADATQYNVVTFPGCTDGVWNASNGIGAFLMFSFAAGPTLTLPAEGVWTTGNFVAAPGQVNAVAATSDVFRLTGVVIVPGYEAPSAAQSPLIMRPFDQELVTCRRYWRDYRSLIASGNNLATGGFFSSWGIDPPMRPTPTLVLLNGVFTNCTGFAGNGVTASSFSTLGTIGSSGYAFVTFDATLNARL